MKSLSRFCLVVLIAAWMPLAFAQDTANPPEGTAKAQQREQVRKEVDEAVEAIRGYSIGRRREAVERARESLAETDRRMDRLESQMSERWARMGSAARQREKEAMADLRRRRNDVAEWTGGMRHGSSDAWEDVKAGFARSYHELAAALHEARMQFERDQAQDASTDPQKTSAEKQQEQER